MSLRTLRASPSDSRGTVAVDAHGVAVEGDQVCRQALFDPAAVGDAEDLRRLTGEAPHGLFQREDALLAGPVRKKIGGEAGVAQLAGVGAGVGQSQHRSVVLQELADLLLVVVGQHDAEAGLEVLVEGEVDGGFEGFDASLVGDVAQGAAHEGLVALGLGDGGLLPARREHAAGVVVRPLAPRRIGVDVGPPLAGNRQHLFEGVEGGEGERVHGVQRLPPAAVKIGGLYFSEK